MLYILLEEEGKDYSDKEGEDYSGEGGEDYSGPSSPETQYDNVLQLQRGTEDYIFKSE